MAYEFELSTKLPATPREIYEAWMSSEGHTAMTGGVAHVEAHRGGTCDAWDGYITGKTLELEPNRRIVQSWRTLHFADQDHER